MYKFYDLANLYGISNRFIRPATRRDFNYRPDLRDLMYPSHRIHPYGYGIETTRSLVPRLPSNAVLRNKQKQKIYCGLTHINIQNITLYLLTAAK